jgi:hypothetical protein
MSLQDRAYAAGIFIVIGICCIGAYVAVSGFLNSSPSGFNIDLGASATETPGEETAVAGLNTPITFPDTPIAGTISAAIPSVTPKGFEPSATPPSRGTPSPAFLADVPTAAPSDTPGSEPSPTAAQAATVCRAQFCPRIGVPDAAIAPTGRACPDNYIWGVVYDHNGKGIPGALIHFIDPSGAGSNVAAKGPPDPAGRYDIPTAGGGVWKLQLRDGNGNPLSPVVQIQARQIAAGSDTCPTRVDFHQQ